MKVVPGLLIVMIAATISAAAAGELSLKVAEGLQAKIEAMKLKEMSPDRSKKTQRTEMSEVELESYVMFLLRDKIPAKIDWVDFQLSQGMIGTNTQLTIGPEATGNFIVDRIIRGTHMLWVRGNFSGSMGKAKFDLESVRVDNIRVPVILVQLVFNTFVRPVYPAADVTAPFAMPFGIDGITVVPGKAVVQY
jgi:hypothetical protein